jgi:hypothetical protein
MKVTEQIDAMGGNQSVQIPGGDPYFSDDTNGSSTCNICRWRWYAWRIYWYKYAWRRQSFRYISKVFDSLAFIDIIRDNQNVLLWFFYWNDWMLFNVENGTASVGQAANSAVVTASLTILSLIC